MICWTVTVGSDGDTWETFEGANELHGTHSVALDSTDAGIGWDGNSDAKSRWQEDEEEHAPQNGGHEAWF